MNYMLKNGKMQIIVSTLGAELKSVRGNDSYEYMWQGDARYWSDTSPVLFPICGRLLDSKYTYGGVEFDLGGHGFAYSNRFEVVKSSEDELILSFKSSEETKKAYPFDFELAAKYKIEGNTLYATFNVTNTSGQTMPYMFGWHPGFNLECENGSTISDFTLDYGKTVEVDWYPLENGWVNATPVKYQFDSPTVPLNEELIYKYDTLIYQGTENKVTLSSKKEKHSVDMSWSDNLPYLCIWKEPTDKARFICIEPWSSIPGDGSRPECFDDRKMDRLAKGESCTYSYTVTFA